MLPRWLRYKDLHEAGIVSNRPQLDHMIETEGFPQGRLFSPRIRAWALDEVEAWLDSRPRGKVADERGIIRLQRERKGRAA
jgi:predicted DNA-binding transcriptional regulator AlpA